MKQNSFYENGGEIEGETERTGKGEGGWGEGQTHKKCTLLAKIKSTVQSLNPKEMLIRQAELRGPSDTEKIPAA